MIVNLKRRQEKLNEVNYEEPPLGYQHIYQQKLYKTGCGNIIYSVLKDKPFSQ